MTRARITIASISTLAMAGGLVLGGRYVQRTDTNYRAQRALTIGMPANDVVRLVGRPPDCVVRIARSEAWFYWSEPLFADTCPSALSRPSELPHELQSLQVLVGADQRVVAYALEGEWSVVSSRGPAKGSSLAGIPLSHYE